MIQKITYTKLSLISLLLFSISSVHTYANISFGGTNVEWSLAFIHLLLFALIIKKYCPPIQYQILNPVKYYIVWNIICILFGVFTAENYWDWKSLITNSLALMMPLVAYPLVNSNYFSRFFNFYFFKVLPFFLILIFIIVPDGYGFFLVPVSFFILFFPIINNKSKVILLILTLIVIFSDFGARSSIIKFSLPLILSIGFYFRSFFTVKFFNIVRQIFIILPFLLFCLGVTGIFNIFNIGDYIPDEMTKETKRDDGEVVDENLKVDTRTFLYEEVLKSAVKHKYIFFGRTPARGNDSESFGWSFETQVTGRHERIGNEVGILNVFTWTGLVGVVLYFLIFSKASYLAINYSNNYFSKMAGIYITFRWCYAWVEDINGFTLNYFMIWATLAFCYSLDFRKMTDNEIKLWAKSIFITNKEITIK